MDLQIEVGHPIATVTLNRPAALNALTKEMAIELRVKLREWANAPHIKAIVFRGAGDKAFCAGGDVRALHESATTGGTLHHDFFVVEYELDYLIHRYPKPTICLMDGITMGGGMGIAQATQFRIATDRTRIAMPEVGIGLIPDVGASYFLSRLPGRIGWYLALTGNQVRAADALYARLADLYLSRDAVTRLGDVLRQVQWTHDPHNDVRHALESIATPSSSAPLEGLRSAIDFHFRFDNVAAILESLRAETAPELSTWAQQTIATLLTRSPITVAVALRQLARGKTLHLADCFRMELGLVRHCFDRGDFIEGVRALIIDKDNRPRWRHASIAAVSQADLDNFFSDPWAGRPHPLAKLEAAARSD